MSKEKVPQWKLKIITKDERDIRDFTTKARKQPKDESYRLKAALCAYQYSYDLSNLKISVNKNTDLRGLGLQGCVFTGNLLSCLIDEETAIMILDSMITVEKGTLNAHRLMVIKEDGTTNHELQEQIAAKYPSQRTRRQASDDVEPAVKRARHESSTVRISASLQASLTAVAQAQAETEAEVSDLLAPSPITFNSDSDRTPSPPPSLPGGCSRVENYSSAFFIDGGDSGSDITTVSLAETLREQVGSPLARGVCNNHG
jgi:hypothetical protein